MLNNIINSFGEDKKEIWTQLRKASLCKVFLEYFQLVRSFLYTMEQTSGDYTNMFQILNYFNVNNKIVLIYFLKTIKLKNHNIKRFGLIGLTNIILDLNQKNPILNESTL